MSSCDGVGVYCIIDICYVLRSGRLAAVLKSCYRIDILLKLLWHLILSKILKIIAINWLIKLAKLFPHYISGFRCKWCLIGLK